MNRLAPGDLVEDGLWRVIGKLGEGTYSEIFGGVNRYTGELVALKTERPPSATSAETSSDVLYWEGALLQRLQRYPCAPGFLRYTKKVHSETTGAPQDDSQGSLEGSQGTERRKKVNVLVMQLLGPNITQIRKQQPQGKFRFHTICHIGKLVIQTIWSDNGLMMN
jgi:hypothetical protein